jgi:hypothetical protein
VNYLDVGPTADFSVDGLPQTDNLVGFEDLIMFAINFGQVSRVRPSEPETAPIETPSLALEIAAGVGSTDEMTARIVLHDNVESVKGIHSVVTFDADRLELLDVESGEALDGQTAPVFFKDLPGAGEVTVDAAILGRTTTLSGSGVVAELRFRALEKGAAPRLAEAVLRDRNNGPAGRPTAPIAEESGRQATDATFVSLPDRLELVGARPNPFDRSTEIVFRLPETARVAVRIHDVTGRVVRTLVDRSMAAGESRVTWDGRTDDGLVAGSGIYFYSFQANDHRETRKIVRFH